MKGSRNVRNYFRIAAKHCKIVSLFVLGFGLVFLGQHFYKKTEAFLEKANHTEGLVVDFNESDSSDSTTYAAVVEYRDRQGQNHKLVDSFSSSPPSYNTGQIVSVLYNRENPGEAQIDRGRANYWLTFLLGFGGVLFILLGAFSARRRFGGPKGYWSFLCFLYY